MLWTMKTCLRLAVDVAAALLQLLAIELTILCESRLAAGAYRLRQRLVGMSPSIPK